MKTVVITGSARGFGLTMAKEFLNNNCNVVISDINQEALEKTKNNLIKEKYQNFLTIQMDVTKENDIKNLINEVLEKYNKIDIWINNAGVNQSNLPIWELDSKEIERLIDIDLKGSILCSKLIMPIMIKNNGGQIFNVEGHGSNDATILGLSIYGTTKRAVTYFTESLAFESEKLNTNVLIGKITPGIMITDFITTSVTGQKFELDEKTKKIYNILGDYPETIAKYIVPRVLTNTQNNVKIAWLTNRKAAFRFMTSGFNKRNFFDK